MNGVRPMDMRTDRSSARECGQPNAVARLDEEDGVGPVRRAAWTGLVELRVDVRLADIMLERLPIVDSCGIVGARISTRASGSRSDYVKPPSRRPLLPARFWPTRSTSGRIPSRDPDTCWSAILSDQIQIAA
jgi:hypothetical protein